MWIAVNYFLLVMALVVLTMGIGFFIHNKETVGNTRTYVLLYSVCSAVWCISYGVMGIVDDLTYTPYIRIFGAFAINAFLVVEVFLASELNHVEKKISTGTRVISIVLAIIDFFIFSNVNVDQFVKIGEWVTWYHNPAYKMHRYFHTVFVCMAIVNLLINGCALLARDTFTRQKKFIKLIFAANVIMFLFSLPDTFMPMLQLPAVPTSGLGAALCTMVVWYGAVKLHSFDIKIGNVGSNVFQFINAGVLVFDLDYKLSMANPCAKTIFSHRELQNATLEELFSVDALQRQEIFDGAMRDTYVTHLKARATDSVYSVRVSVARDDYQEPYCYICVMVDVTDEITMVRELEQANYAKTAFLTSISHEIRTPINAVLGFDEMILRQGEKKEVLECAGNIKRAGNMLLTIINDLLDMGQIASGKLSIVPEEYDLGKLLSDVYLMQMLRAEEKNLSFTILNNEKIPQMLYGDSIRIQQIITNLVSNAIKYTMKGSVQMVLDYQETGAGQIDLMIQVSDTGMGIKEEDLPYLFDSFRRFEEKKNRHIEGTGIGLSIIKDLVEMMYGTVSVESVYGEGSCFTVRIPQGVIHRAPLGCMDKKRLQQVEVSERQSFVAPEARILVVDDNEMNLMVFQGLLEHLQMEIDAVDSGEAMLKAIKEKSYDIIFLDQMMPEMSGVEAFENMRRDKTHKNQETPVIAMTANAIRGAKETYLKEGFQGYIEKPAKLFKLEEIIEKFLAKDKMLPAKQQEVLERVEQQNTDLPDIPGVDWGMAFRHVTDAKVLQDIIKTFYASAEKELEELENFYRKIEIEEKESFSPYRIKVHSMKHSAALVGAQDVSDRAKELEYAAKDGDGESLCQQHDFFVQQYKALAMDMKQAFSKREEQSNQQWRELLKQLREAMDDFDTTRLNELTFSITYMEIKEPVVKEKIKQLQTAIRDFDQEAFYRILQELEA